MVLSFADHPQTYSAQIKMIFSCFSCCCCCCCYSLTFSATHGICMTSKLCFDSSKKCNYPIRYQFKRLSSRCTRSIKLINYKLRCTNAEKTFTRDDNKQQQQQQQRQQQNEFAPIFPLTLHRATRGNSQFPSSSSSSSRGRSPKVSLPTISLCLG